MNSNSKPRRVVITGLGLVTALGADVDKFWDRLTNGVSGIRRITQFDPTGFACQIAGELPDFEPRDYMNPKEARRMARASQVSIAAAKLAAKDAGLEIPIQDLELSESIGVYFGTAVGGNDQAMQGVELWLEKGISARVNPFLLPSSLPNMPSFHVAQELSVVGPSSTITTACATGTQTVGEAADAIRHGRAEMMFAGGVEALIREYVFLGFGAMRALPTSFNDDPEHASRPFDALREGFVFSEGSACLVLESYDRARARGAHIYAVVLGQASSSDGYHMAVPDPTARGAVRTMEWALKYAHVNPDEVDYINAHGTSTPANDAVESLAIKKLFGERAYEIPVSSTKSMIGHAMGASGAIEAAVCALTIDRGVIHPTINLEHPDPDCDLDYVPHEARERDVQITLSNSFGLGGQNACLVLGKVQD